MLSQNVLNRAEADRIAVGQLPLGRSGQELSDEPLDVGIRQPVSPHARSAAPGGIGRLVLLHSWLSNPGSNLRQSFLQVGAVRVAPDKLHQVKRACRGRLSEHVQQQSTAVCLASLDP